MTKTSTETIKGPFADLTNDVAFKWVFGREETRDLLVALLNELIPDREITDVTLFKDCQLPYSKEFKKGVFDISCKTEDGTLIDVEVQVKPQYWFAERCLYYSTYSIQSQIGKGSDEYMLNPVYVVSIDNFVRNHSEQWKGDILSHYMLREVQTGERMTDKLHFVFVELPLFKKEWSKLDNDKERFYFCLKHLHELDEIPVGMLEGLFLKLAGQSKVHAMPANVKQEYLENMTTEIDKRAQMKYALSKATEQGLAEGKAEGRAESAREIAKNFKTLGISVKDIAKATGLTEAEVNAL